MRNLKYCAKIIAKNCSINLWNTSKNNQNAQNRFDIVIRQALVLLCFAPMSAVAPAYTGMCGGDEGMASCANSVTILCSLVTITALLAFMGLY